MKPTAILLLLFLSARMFAQHGIDPHWLASPKQLTPSATGALAGGAVANNMVVLGDTVLIFYKENNLNYWAGSNDHGVTWKAPSAGGVPPCQKTAGNSTISADSDTKGNIHILWSATNPAGLWYSQLPAGSSQWTEPVKVNDTIYTSLAFSQLTTDRKGRLHAMWQDGSQSSPTQAAESFYARSTDNGVTWEPQLGLSKRDGRHSAFPNGDFAGTSSDTLAIVWRDSVSPDQKWDVLAALTYDGGKTWQQPITAAGGAGSQWDPNLIVGRDGVLHLSFHLYPPSNAFNASIHYTRSLDGGKTWQPLAQLSELNQRSQLIKSAYDFTNNIVWIFWKDERDFNFSNGIAQADIIGSAIADGGARIFPPEFLTDGGATEYGFHNFKVGADGIPRAHFCTIVGGKVKDLFYTERSGVITSSYARTPSAPSIQVWPNPACEWLYITVPAPGTIQVFDLLGRLRLRGQAGAPSTQSLNLQSLPDGAYFLRFEGEGSGAATVRQFLVGGKG